MVPRTPFQALFQLKGACRSIINSHAISHKQIFHLISNRIKCRQYLQLASDGVGEKNDKINNALKV